MTLLLHAPGHPDRAPPDLRDLSHFGLRTDRQPRPRLLRPAGMRVAQVELFAAWLVDLGIDSISLNPDTVVKTAFVIAEREMTAAV